MAYETHEPMFGQKMGRRGCFGVTGLIFALSFACMGAFVAYMDFSCARDIGWEIAPYPNAEIIDQSHNFFRPFAMGVTVMQQRSEDPPETVKAWYDNLRFRTSARLRVNSMATVLLDVQPAPEGEGSLIALASSCMATASF